MPAKLGHKLHAIFQEIARPRFMHDIQATFNVFPQRSPFLTFRNHGFSTRKSCRGPSTFSNPRTPRRLASGSFLVLGLSHNSTAAVETGANSAISSENIIFSSWPDSYSRKFLGELSQIRWRRNFHSSQRRQRDDGELSTKATDSGDKPRDRPSKTDGRYLETDTHQDLKKLHDETRYYPASIRPLRNRLPVIPHFHRPTKEELLAAATGFWSRLRVRFKWFSIRSVRPFTLDEIGALFSWVFLGHVIWFIVGTTTFFSLLIFAINTVFAQETLARWVGNYLTKSSGVKVIFESAIVPRWRDGVISFKNVFVSRRPGQGSGNVSKGSTIAATSAALADRRRQNEANMNGSNMNEANTNEANINASQDDIGGLGEQEDTNYTQFDLSVDTVNVTLSFTKWLNGKGLLRDVEVKGIRGVIDRTHVYWSNDDRDPKSYRVEHNPGDFEIDSFKMEDLLVTVYQPNNFRPFSVSIFSCDLPQLRKQWLFYDFLSANMMSGSFDNSLFTIHPRQTHVYTGMRLNNRFDENEKRSPWKKQNRMRIDSLNVDHLNSGIEGPFSWIHEGTVDIVADIMFPNDDDEGLVKVMSDFYERLEAAVTANRYQAEGSEPRMDPLEQESALSIASGDENDKRFVVTDLRIHLNNVKAVVPLFTRDLSYMNNALVRPIVAYMNSRRTFIPINCRLVKRLSDFDGSWTVYDSGLMDDLSAETYDAFARDVVDEQARKRRFKKVGFWSLQLAAQAIFMGMAGNII